MADDPRTPEQKAAQDDCLALLALKDLCCGPVIRGWEVLWRPLCRDYCCTIAVPAPDDASAEDHQVTGKGPTLALAIRAALRSAGLVRS